MSQEEVFETDDELYHSDSDEDPRALAHPVAPEAPPAPAPTAPVAPINPPDAAIPISGNDSEPPRFANPDEFIAYYMGIVEMGALNLYSFEKMQRFHNNQSLPAEYIRV